MSPEETFAQADRALAARDAGAAELALTAVWADIWKAPAEAQHTMANVRMAQGRYAEAEELLRSATRAEPKSLRHHIALGHLLVQRADFGAATEAYASAMRIDPKWPGLVAVYSDACYRVGRFDESEKAARHWIAATPNAAAYDMLSCALRQQGKAKEALAAAEQALQLDPANAGAKHSRGAALLKLGRHEEALAIFEALLRGGFQAPVIYLNRGRTLLALKRNRDAAEAFGDGLRRYPADKDLQQAVAGGG